MASYIADVFEPDIFVSDLFTGVHTDKILEFNINTKTIYLNPGITTYNPVEDLYKEMRFHRRYDESLRVLDTPIEALGNVAKGGGSFTGRLAVIKHGWKIRPADSPTNPNIVISGEQIDGLGLAGLDLVDTTNMVYNVSMAYFPPPVTEIVYVGTTASTDTTAPVWDGPIGIVDCYQDGKFITARWNSASDENKVRYRVFISTSLTNVFDNVSFYGSFTGNMANISTEADGVSALLTQTYYVGIRAIDTAGNETTNANYAIVGYDVAAATPLTAQNIWEYATRTLTAATGSSLTTLQNDQLMSLQPSGLDATNTAIITDIQDKLNNTVTVKINEIIATLAAQGGSVSVSDIETAFSNIKIII
jgi:hypothetical protein